jgi:hypothetical protein
LDNNTKKILDKLAVAFIFSVGWHCFNDYENNFKRLIKKLAQGDKKLLARVDKFG